MRQQVDVAEENQVVKRPRMTPMWHESCDAIAVMDRRTKFDLGKLSEEDLFLRERAFADPDRLLELVDSSESGLLQKSSLARQWERRQENAVQLLRQQFETLNMQRIQAELKHQLIVEGQWAPTMNGVAFSAKQEGGEMTSPMDEDELSTSGAFGSQGSSIGSISSPVVDDIENSVDYWKERAKILDLLLAESLQREQVLLSRLQEDGVQPILSGPPEELKEILQRLDNFLHLSLWKAPVIIAHQDVELRYRFIFNPFPGLTEDAILGKTDAEIFQGSGVEDCIEFKNEVMQRGWPLQREISFQTDLFGFKIFLISAEPVISTTGETLGLNYVAVDITEEASRREKLILLREEAAVQKAMETELNRSLVVTEEAMRAKQMLATMSHEIRSPLSGVVSMAQVLARTRLDSEQRSMVDLMNSSGDHVLELINDILDLSKAESGLMKMEAKKFRPRQVVKHVLQLATASVQNKPLSLGGKVDDGVPVEVVGDVLRIRQVLTNLVSNAIKFTHKGAVEIKVQMAPPPLGSIGSVKSETHQHHPVVDIVTSSPIRGSNLLSEGSSLEQESCKSTSLIGLEDSKDGSDFSDISRSTSTASTLTTASSATLSSSSSFSTRSVGDGKIEEEAGPTLANTGPLSTFPGGVWDLSPKSYELSEEIWVHFEVTDTGIGIPEAALPSLFEQYTQASTTTARKYGGTGLGLAICKQLVGLMGGTLEVKSTQHVGSSFSFTLPLRDVKDKTVQDPLIVDDSQTRPTVQARISDGTPKISKGMGGRLHQMLRDSKRSWGNALGESNLGVAGKSKIPEKALPRVVSVENTRESSSSDVASGSSSKSSSLEPLEVNQKCGIVKSKAVSIPSASLKANLPKKNSGSLKTTTPVQKGSPTDSQVKPRYRRPPRILLAEDNKVNVVVAQSMLKRLGHSLEVVSNGAEAVQALQRSDYDLVLMFWVPLMDIPACLPVPTVGPEFDGMIYAWEQDVSMPVMDGLEATRLIRKFEETGQWQYRQGQSATETSLSSSVTSCDVVPPVQHSETTRMSRPSSRQKTPIIAMTANAMAENVAECYNNGMDSFIAKPVTFEKLEQVLKQYLTWLEYQRVQTG